MRKVTARDIIRQIFGGKVLYTYTRRRVRKVQKRRTKKQSAQYVTYKEPARLLVHERLEYWNAIYAFPYGKVTIKDQKTRWGSCSSKGNLNFSYKLVFLPMHLVDYVVVHELCHLKEFNHGPKFWALITETIPDYNKRIHELKLQGRRCVVKVPPHYTGKS